MQRYVQDCVICQTYKSSTLSHAGLIQPFPLPTRVWDEIALDFIEGLPTSQGVNVVLVVIDRLSKYAHFLSLCHPFTTVEVANCFVEGIVRLHRFSSSIVSDRDRIFLSYFWKEAFRLAGTQLKYSAAFHPQTDGQSEVLNCCLETYLCCFASAHPRMRRKFLPWADFWYNTSLRTSLKTTPFQVVYGWEPLVVVKFEEGSTNNFYLETSLRECDRVLALIKQNLVRAQDIMKKAGDKHRHDVSFDVGMMVYLKLRSYRQLSVSHRVCQKLAAKYFGPYRVIARMGKAAYKLDLPTASRIHQVFHCSQLKAALGVDRVVHPLPDNCIDEVEAFLEPFDILEKRYDDAGYLELPVSWVGKPSHEHSWVPFRSFVKDYPSFKLEDKLGFKGRSIDRYQRS